MARVGVKGWGLRVTVYGWGLERGRRYGEDRRSDDWDNGPGSKNGTSNRKQGGPIFLEGRRQRMNVRHVERHLRTRQ